MFEANTVCTLFVTIVGRENGAEGGKEEAMGSGGRYMEDAHGAFRGRRRLRRWCPTPDTRFWPAVARPRLYIVAVELSCTSLSSPLL
jgi:hypothetical protein